MNEKVVAMDLGKLKKRIMGNQSVLDWVGKKVHVNTV
jgi:hypothetical protein